MITGTIKVAVIATTLEKNVIGILEEVIEEVIEEARVVSAPEEEVAVGSAGMTTTAENSNNNSNNARPTHHSGEATTVLSTRETRETTVERGRETARRGGRQIV